MAPGVSGALGAGGTTTGRMHRFVEPSAQSELVDVSAVTTAELELELQDGARSVIAALKLAA
jgi:hypothetical protein